MSKTNTSEKKVVLPLSNETPITFDLRSGIPFMATLSYDSIKNDVWNWIFTDYMQLVCGKKKSCKLKYNFFRIFEPYNPFLIRKFDCHYRKSWRNTNKTLNYVIENISNGYYIHLKLDRYFMPGFAGFNEKHIMHTECIYGFDLEKEELYLIGFTDFTNSSLKKTTLSFRDFLRAFESFLNQHIFHTITLDKVKLNTKFDFDKEKMVGNLYDYINSTLSLQKIYDSNKDKQTIFAWDFPIKTLYGIEGLNHMSKLIEYVCENQKLTRIRKFLQINCEFHKIMFLRIKYLYEKFNLPENFYKEYSEIYEDFNLIKFIYLKYDVTDNKDYLETVIEKLESNAKKSEWLLQRILFELNGKKEFAQSIPTLKKKIEIIKHLIIAVFKDVKFFVINVLWEQIILRVK